MLPERPQIVTDAIEKRQAKLGTGTRFKQLTGELAAQGAKDPEALAAWIGRRKYGKKKYTKLGRKRKVRKLTKEGDWGVRDGLIKHRSGEHDQKDHKKGYRKLPARFGRKRIFVPDVKFTHMLDVDVAKHGDKGRPGYRLLHPSSPSFHDDIYDLKVGDRLVVKVPGGPGPTMEVVVAGPSQNPVEFRGNQHAQLAARQIPVRNPVTGKEGTISAKQVLAVVTKHGDKGAPGYRILHPGRAPGESHRPESRGISERFGRARNVNLKPRPKSGLGKPGKPGQFKEFMQPEAAREKGQARDIAVSRNRRRRKIAGRAGVINVTEAVDADIAGRAVELREASARGPTPRRKVPAPGGGGSKPTYASRQESAAAMGFIGALPVAPQAVALKPGEGRQIIAVDMAPDFVDAKAIDAFLDNIVEQETSPEKRPWLILEKPGRGGRDAPGNVYLRNEAKKRGFHVEDDVPKGTEGTGTLMQRRANRLGVMARIIENERGRGFVVGFRNPGKTVGVPEDLVAGFLRRGPDSRGNQAEALMVVAGYRGRKENGVDVDTNAFGLGATDLPAGHRRAPKPKGKKGKLAAAIRRMIQQPKAKVTPRQKSWTDPADSPAGKHLAGGGRIEDAPGDGLVESVQSMPERFKLKSLGIRTPAFFAYDKDNNNIPYFFKRAENGGDVDMYGDGMNEVLAARLGRAAFPRLFPETVFASPPEGERNPFVRMDHVAAMYPDYEPGAGYEFSSGGKLKDPRQALAIHIFDYLIDQIDRHGGNWMEAKDRKTGEVVLVPIDNGGAFHAYTEYWGSGGGHDWPPEMWEQPETISYSEWWKYAGNTRNGGKASIMGAMTQDSYKAQGWNSAKMRQDAAAIIEAFKKVDAEGMAQQLREMYPDMDEYERNHLTGAILIWQNRVGMIEPDEVVKAVMKL